MGLMQPTKFAEFVEAHGTTENYAAGQVFHTQDFPDKLFLLKSGYVKRYQATKPTSKVIELIYGPGHVISLSQLYKRLFGIDQNQYDSIYIYQAMTDVELESIDADIVLSELEKDVELYRDFFYEAGLKLRSNISRLASNSIKDEYKKVAHQVLSLAYEFADYSEGDTRTTIELPLPQTSIDIAEQLNITEEAAQKALKELADNNIIDVQGSKITILNTGLLRDAYL